MKANNPNAPLERDADEAARAGLSNSKIPQSKAGGGVE